MNAPARIRNKVLPNLWTIPFSFDFQDHLFDTCTESCQKSVGHVTECLLQKRQGRRSLCGGGLCGKMRILFVEDSADQAAAVIARLKRSGHAVDWVGDGEQAVQVFQHGVYDLVLLDLVLPKLDGEIFLRRLRAMNCDVPVLVVSARGGLDEKVRVLDVGADDYVVKPYELNEIEARIRALLRRPQGRATSATTIGNLVFDIARRRIEIDGRNVRIGQREFRLLELFLGKLDHLLTKEAILDHLFSYDEPATPNAIELYVSRLRKKLAGTEIEIRTVWGEGYVSEINKHK